MRKLVRAVGAPSDKFSFDHDSAECAIADMLRAAEARGDNFFSAAAMSHARWRHLGEFKIPTVPTYPDFHPRLAGGQKQTSAQKR